MAYSPPEIEYYLVEMEIINRAEHSGALNITKRADSLTKADLTEILPHKAYISSLVWKAVKQNQVGTVTFLSNLLKVPTLCRLCKGVKAEGS